MQSVGNSAAGKKAPVREPAILATVILCLLMLAYALSVTMIGPLMPRLIEHYQLRMSQGGLIITFQSIGGILAITVGGFIADLAKKQLLIGIGFAAYSLVLFLIGLAPAFGVILPMFFLLGTSTRLFDTVTNAYIADLHPGKQGVFLSLLHAFFGVGALVGPLYAQQLINRGAAWNQTFKFLSTGTVMLLIVYVVFLQLRLNPNAKSVNSKRPRVRETTSPVQLLKSPRMWVLCAIIFLYGGHQIGTTVWLPMYMEENLGASPSLASLALTVFWVGIVLGRLVSSPLTVQLSEKKQILWGSLLGGLLLVLGITLKTPILLLFSAGVTGMLTGAFIPLSVAIACRSYPLNTGTASSMLFLSLTASAMIFPWLIGVIAEATGFLQGMLVTGITLLLIFVITLFTRNNEGEVE